MKTWLAILTLCLLAGCQSNLTPKEEQKLQRMNEAMSTGDEGLQNSGAVQGPVDGGNNPARPAILDGSVEL